MPSPVEHNDDLAPVTRRASAPDHLLATPRVHQDLVTLSVDKKPFLFPTDLLIAASPYMKRTLAEVEGHEGRPGSPEQLSWEGGDEVAMALFQRWIIHDVLAGPNDFHSFQHYLGLYVLARKYEVEVLENEGQSGRFVHSARYYPPRELYPLTSVAETVMDHIRLYYATEKMTASALRLEYMYTYTHEANPMRRFLVATAAFRALCEEPPRVPSGGGGGGGGSSSSSYVAVSDSIRGILASNSEMALDFIEALVRLHQNGCEDVRRAGHACEWHVHLTTPPCPREVPEPWQADGAAG